jgi:hypothetical protein
MKSRIGLRCFAFRVKLVLVGIMAVVSSNACAQGGGFGGGGRGGGGVAEGDLTTYRHILTPGDRGEWTLTVRAGETVLVSVSSTSFDPAAEIVDAAGKVVAQNDDVRAGDQDALILYRFPAAGDYKILVKGFKSAAGGQFTLALRRFLPTDLRRGERTATVLGKTRLQWHRFSAKIGETLVVTTRSAVFDPDAQLYAPNGERLPVEVRASNGGRMATQVFRAESSGDYHLRVAPSSDLVGGYAVTVATARVAPIMLGGTTPQRHLDAGGLDLWTFAGTVGDLIRIEAQSVGVNASVGLNFLPPTAKVGGATTLVEAEDNPVRLPSDPKGRGVMVMLLKRTGSYQVEVSQPAGQEMDYTLRLVQDVKPWPANQEISATLPLGGSEYWAVEGKAGQIVRLAGMAVPFDIHLDLYTPRGERIEVNDDGDGDRNALLTELLKETGRYLLRVSAFGDGGSGAYKLVRRPDPTRPLQIGSRTEGKLGAGNSDVWSFRGKAGQVVILSIRSQEFDPRATIFGPDTIEVANDAPTRDGTDSLLSIRLPLDGVYTVWIAARGGGGKYIIHLVDAD